MATKIYDISLASLMDGTVIELAPLKIKYLRQFLETFNNVKKSENDDEAITHLTSCALVAMQQYYPSVSTIDELEDLIDLPTVYKILDAAAGIKINKDKTEETVKKQAVDSGATWESLDLAKLEAEVFLLGIWKDYDELESSLSMPELTATLTSKREIDYQEKKFAASMQGIDLDKNSNKTNAWEEMKARVFSKGQTSDPNDILSYQGVSAQKAGFGIGMGIGYERVD